ncbi:MAG: Glu-tRNA(Gln) amidotransferase subunit GatE [Thermoplasmata archaeon]|nr:Glu-tRNA(Gln) amidotransferase subunit GatE [Thermoplasmata archaeon]
MKVGLEVHQQLAMSKLFCDCPAELSEEVGQTFSRRLRASGGENRAIDPAAALQASRELLYRYESGPSNCLVEMDEEPPHALNPEALDTALQLALLLEARPVDEVEVMRKIVVDGSNTTGFQRTALIATDGHLDVGGRRHAIDTICLEEDAARKVSDSKDGITYRLDRLGIPLVEIATGPDIHSGLEAREVAEEIGALLRSTGRVRRGIGTIREDLNVSTEGGRRIEIKGVQELRMIGEYTDREVARQEALLRLRDRLLRRGVTARTAEIRDVGEFLADVVSGPLAGAPGKRGVILALSLRGFAGMLRGSDASEERLGRELADQARAVGLGGLLHSDELPGHGLGTTEVVRLREALGLDEPDAFVLVVAPTRERAEAALVRVAERARSALEGIPGETRDPLPDGRTRYSRPLAGKDRMYPETDVPPVAVPEERLRDLSSHLPERPATLRHRLASTFQLPPDLVRQLVAAGDASTLEELVRRGRSPGPVSRLLTQELAAAVAAAPRGSDVELSLDQLDALLRGAESGQFSKEGIPGVLAAWMAGAPTLDAAVERAGLAGPVLEDLDSIADRVVAANAGMVRDRGAAAFSPLMGDMMREVRGRRDGKDVAEALHRALARFHARPPP